MPQPGEVVLEAQNLVKTFSAGRRNGGIGRGRISAVDGVSLQLRGGESVGIVGESGCGKSTLARMLVGLERPDSGRVLYRQLDGTNPRRAQRRILRQGVQMVFQDPYTSLDPRMTVFEIVGEPLAAGGAVQARAARRDRVAALLEQVGLSAAMLERYPHQFSGGQRQRIGIARALALEPDVLVCDEPVSALDVSVQAQVVNLLRDLQRQTGIGLVFIAHDLSVVRHVADRTCVMYLGRLAETGPTESIYRAPTHPYTRALLSAAPVTDRTRRGGMRRRILLAGDPPSPADPPSGCRFRTRCPLADDACAPEPPPLRVVAGVTAADHTVACVHAERSAAEAVNAAVATG